MKERHAPQYAPPPRDVIHCNIYVYSVVLTPGKGNVAVRPPEGHLLQSSYISVPYRSVGLNLTFNKLREACRKNTG